MTLLVPEGGPMGSCRGACLWKSGLNQSAHHSQTFPATLWRPKPFGGVGVDGCGAQVAVVQGVVGGEAALPDVAAVLPAGGELVAPGEACVLQASARCVLPLGFGGQSHARPSAQ